MAVSNCGLLGGVTVLVYSNLVPMVDQPHCTCEGWHAESVSVCVCWRLCSAGQLACQSVNYFYFRNKTKAESFRVERKERPVPNSFVASCSG